MQKDRSQKNHGLPKLLRNWALLALGILLAAGLSDGIRYDDGWSLALAVLLLSFLNSALRPLLALMTLPFIVLTLGLGLLVVNAALVLITAAIVPGFHVDGFWPALWAACAIALAHLAVNLISGKNRVRVRFGQFGSDSRRRGPAPKNDDDVIDI